MTTTAVTSGNDTDEFDLDDITDIDDADEELITSALMHANRLLATEQDDLDLAFAAAVDAGWY